MSGKRKLTIDHVSENRNANKRRRRYEQRFNQPPPQFDSSDSDSSDYISPTNSPPPPNYPPGPNSPPPPNFPLPPNSPPPPDSPPPPPEYVQEVPDKCLNDILRVWKATRSSVTMQDLQDLLRELHDAGFNCYKDIRSLMKIKKEFKFKTTDNLLYKELQFQLKPLVLGLIAELREKNIVIPETIILLANSDGVSPDKATSKGYWTLLIMPVNLPSKIVIPVSLTFGRGYPPDLEWFERGIEQIVELLNFTTECGVKFTLRNIICDLPAVCYVKCICNFGATLTPCSICSINATHSLQANCRIFDPPSVESPHWTHTDFKNFRCANQLRDKISPLSLLSDKIHLIYDVPPDPMHICYGGFFERFILAMWSGIKTKKGGTLSNKQKVDLSQTMSIVNNQLKPVLFARRPRLLFELTHYKAAEYRCLLLYCSIVAFRNNVGNREYNLLKKIFCAVVILETRPLLQQEEFLVKAEQLLLEACTLGDEIFGKSFLTVKSHMMCHFVFLARRHGTTLSENSAFGFESWNINIGQNIKTRVHALVEFAKRYLEKVSVTFLPNPRHEEVRQKKLQKLTDFIIDNRLVEVVSSNPVQGTSVVKRYPEGTDYFTDPIRSTSIHIFQVKKDTGTEEVIVNTHELSTYCVKLCIDKKNYVVLPLRHQIL